jgi:hypothetical protein
MRNGKNIPLLSGICAKVGKLLVGPEISGAILILLTPDF